MVKLEPLFKVVKHPDGKLRLDAEAKKIYDVYAKSLKVGETYYLSVKKKKGIRSLNLNEYYWGVVIRIFCEYTGFEPDEAHEFFKLKFNSIKRFNPKTNRDLPPLPKSTTGNDNVEFIEYYQKIQRWCAKGGDEEEKNPWDYTLEGPIYIPDPNEVDY